MKVEDWPAIQSKTVAVLTVGAAAGLVASYGSALAALHPGSPVQTGQPTAAEDRPKLADMAENEIGEMGGMKAMAGGRASGLAANLWTRR